MNTTLILTTIGAKNAFDIVTGTAKLLTKTTKAIVNTSVKHKDFKTFFESSDIEFKLTTVQTYVDAHPDNICYKSMKTLLDKIHKILLNVKMKEDLNKNMRIKYFNYNFDTEIADLDNLIEILDNRFELMIKVN